MWQRFSERARRVVFQSQDEAQRVGDLHVDTEHLLLGIVCIPECTAAQIITSIAPSLSQVRDETEKLLAHGGSKPRSEMTLTPGAKRVIDLAYGEARNFKSDYIGTEHLLLGLILEESGLAARVLSRLGVNDRGVREEILARLGPGATYSSIDQKGNAAWGQREISTGGTWRKFSSASRQAIFESVAESLRQGISLVYPEHLLLGVIASPENHASLVLAALGIPRESLQSAVRKRLVDGYTNEAGESKLSISSKSVIDRAMEQARTMNSSYVGTHHLLLAIADEEKSFVAETLRDLGFVTERGRGVAFSIPSDEE